MQLPTWERSEAAVNDLTPTALQAFIHAEEPVGKWGEDRFRIGLTALLDEETEACAALCEHEGANPDGLLEHNDPHTYRVTCAYLAQVIRMRKTAAPAKGDDDE